MLLGAFILVCFIIWIAWRTMKKPKKDDERRGGGFSRLLPKRFASKFSFGGKRSWQSLDDATITGSPPPSYREKTRTASATSVEGFYGTEKAREQPQQDQDQDQDQDWDKARQPSQHPQQQEAPLSIPSEAVFPQPPHPLRSNSVYQPQFYPTGMYYNPANVLHITNMANNPLYSHQPQESFSSTNAAQFGSTMAGDYPINTLQTGTTAGPTMYYNPSLMTQQFPAATPYNPAGVYRQPSKATSEVSSLSSGFGDDDIIVAESPISAPPPVAATTSGRGQYAARFSWMSQAQSQTQKQGVQSRRETVYTETSEDLPARFRSVTSWVDQQTGRIKRAQQREMTREKGMEDQMPPPVPQVLPGGNPGIPGIHNPPGEQSFGMMMDDEEKPRRVDEALAGSTLGRTTA